MISSDQNKHPKFIGADIKKLILTDFRNYKYTSIEINKKFIVLIGNNGAGKTNILEAISLLSPGRGIRTASTSDYARKDGQGGWSVFSELNGINGMVRVGTGITKEQITDGKRRQCRVDGSFVGSPSFFSSHVQFISLTPVMDRLFIGSSSDRRKFLDRLVISIDPHHRINLGKYEKAMAQRNSLLFSSNNNDKWIDSIEMQMSEYGVAIASARVVAIKILNEEIISRKQHSVFPPAIISINGKCESALNEISATDLEKVFISELFESRNSDRRVGRTTNGPHRTDFTLFHGTTGIEAENCSTGEQKNLLISIVLAEARISKKKNNGIAPIMLLDEIGAHLDSKRLNNLYEEIIALNAQVWFTGIEAELFNYISDHAAFKLVTDGSIKSL